MSILQGQEIADRLEKLVRKNPAIKISMLGEVLGSPKNVTREAKGQRYAKFLKDVAKVFDQVKKVTKLLGVSPIEVLFPTASQDRKDFESGVLKRLEVMEDSFEVVLSEFKKERKR